MCLSVNAQISQDSNSYNFIPKPEKIIWDKFKAEEFRSLIQSTECRKAVNDFTRTGIIPTQECTDLATDFITKIITKSANH